MTHVTSYKGSRVPCLPPVDNTAGQGLGSLETPGLTGSGGRASRAKQDELDLAEIAAVRAHLLQIYSPEFVAATYGEAE